MTDQLREQIRHNLNQKETDELVRMWQKNDRNEWSDMAFEVIHDILKDRHAEIPPQNIHLDPEGKWLPNLNVEDLEWFRPELEKSYQLLAIARASGDSKKEGQYHLDLGTIFREMTLFGHAIKHFEQALVIFRKLGDRSQEANALARLGMVNFFLQRKTAIEFYEQALRLYREIGDRGAQASQLSNLGLFFASFTNDFEKAIEHYNQALVIYREMGNRNHEASTLNMLGTEYLHLRQMEQAIRCNEQIISISREIGDHHKEAKAFQNLGVICFQVSKYEHAIEYLIQAITIFREIDERDEQAMSLGDLGAVYFNLKQFGKAVECLQKKVDILAETGDVDLDIALKELESYQKAARKKWWQFGL